MGVTKDCQSTRLNREFIGTEYTPSNWNLADSAGRIVQRGGKSLQGPSPKNNLFYIVIIINISGDFQRADSVSQPTGLARSNVSVWE